MTTLIRLLLSAALLVLSYRETHGWATTLLFALIVLANEMNAAVVNLSEKRRAR